MIKEHNKIRPFTEQVGDRSSTVKNTFRKFTWVLRLSGFYVEYGGRPTPRHLSVIMVSYCVICNIVTVFNFGRLTYVTFLLDSDRILSSLPYYLFVFETAYISVLMSLLLPKNYQRFIVLLQERQGAESNGHNYGSKLKSLTIILCIFIVGCGACVTFISPFLSTLVDLPRSNLIPFDFYGNIGLMVYACVFVVGSIRYYVAIVIFNIVSYVICKEFSAFSLKFKRAYQENKDLFEGNFQELWDEYFSLDQLLEQGQKCLKHFVSVSFVLPLPIFCFLVYGLIKSNLSIAAFGFLAVLFLMCASQILNVSIVSIIVNDKAHEPLQHIFRSKWLLRSQEAIQKISLFANKLTAEKVGYSVYSLFTIDRSTILKVGGTLATYTIVVLQIQTGGNNTCVAACFENLNITYLCDKTNV